MSESNSVTSKRWLRYLIYGLVWVAYIVGFNALELYLKPILFGGFNTNEFLIYFNAILELLVFGILLGIEHFINEKKEEGKWSFNIPRIIILGIPSLILGVCGLLEMLGKIIFPIYIMVDSFFFMNIILFGYLIFSNLSKKSETEQTTSKNWLRYLIYGLIIFVCIFSLSLLYGRVNLIFTVIPTELFVYFIIGALLGIEHILNKKKKGGKWSLNLPRIFILGIPSLLVGMYLWLNYSVESINGGNIPYLIIPKSMISSDLIYTMVIIMSGYFLFSSLSKKQLSK